MGDPWPGLFSVQPSNQSEPDCIVQKTINQTLAGENHARLVSDETEKRFQMVHNLVLIPLLFVIGAPLNALILVVYRQQGLNDRLNMCLFSLAAVDLVYLILVLVVNTSRGYWRLKEGETIDAVIRFLINTRLVGLLGWSDGPYFLAAVISADKCMCVLFPFRTRKYVSTRSLAIFIVTGMAVLMSLGFVVLTRLAVRCVYVEETGEKTWGVIPNPSPFYVKNKGLIDGLDVVFFGGVVVIGSVVVVITTTIITAVRLQQLVHWRHSTNISMSRKELGIARMIIWLSLAFAIHTTPALILRFHTIIHPQFSALGKFRNVFLVVISVRELSSSINAFVSFFVYYFCSSKFRVALFRVLPFITGPGTESTKVSKEPRILSECENPA